MSATTENLQSPVTKNPPDQHTPGPWEIWGARVISGNQEVCALAASPVPGGFSLNGETYANGFLIAAAPDLLAALKLMLSGGDTKRPGYAAAAAAAAIAKAEGRS